jgi:peptide/nickel transport system permease protein
MNPWIGFLGRRLFGLVCVLVALVLLGFFMVRLVPGDPVVAAFGAEIPESELQRIRGELGLDKPAVEQLTSYVASVAQGDFGRSFTTNEPVLTTIQQRIGPSLELAAAALMITLLGGLSLGMLAAAWTRNGRHRRSEVAFGGVTSMFGAVPDYVWATVLIFVFAVSQGLLPASGSGGIEYLILPALALGLPMAANIARIVRVETLDVLAQDYTRTARSERIPTWRLYLRHVLPNVLTATLTIGGLIFAGLIGGAVVVETVFARPGLGSSLVTAVTSMNYPVVQGIILVLGLAVVVINTVVDVLLGILDPRTLTKRQ